LRNTVIEEITIQTRKNKNIYFITADLGFNVVNRFYEEHSNNFINAGISEQNMTLMAAGMAISGKKVITYSIGNFNTLRVLEHIRNSICYHNADVKIISLASGFAYGALGFTHHATEDIAVMRAMPNLIIFSPADPVEARICTQLALNINTPCYIRLGRGGEKIIHSKSLKFELGRALKIFDGNDIVIFTTGTILNEAIKSVQFYKQKSFDIALYSFPTIKPIDAETIKICSEKYKYIITVEENNAIAGFGSLIATELTKLTSNVKLRIIGLKDIIPDIVGSQEYLRSIYNIDHQALNKEINEIISQIKI
jgi:transketolase